MYENYLNIWENNIDGNIIFYVFTMLNVIYLIVYLFECLDSLVYLLIFIIKYHIFYGFIMTVVF